MLNLTPDTLVQWTGGCWSIAPQQPAPAPKSAPLILPAARPGGRPAGPAARVVRHPASGGSRSLPREAHA
jgi:hypothetical protein